MGCRAFLRTSCVCIPTMPRQAQLLWDHVMSPRLPHLGTQIIE